MNKKISFAAAVCYVAPAAIELEACSEGVLCASGFDANNHTEVFDRLEIEEL